jgi:hypothetical protein
VATLRGEYWIIDGRTSPADADTTALADQPFSGSPDAGKPGDQYRVHIRVAGKWRTVDWEKIVKEGASEPVTDSGEYSVIGSWFDFAPQPMAASPDESGLYSMEITLPTPGGTFNIIRDGDFGQTFYPAEGVDANGGDSRGPDEASGSWYLYGNVGDVFRIDFRRVVEAGAETQKVTWTKLRTSVADAGVVAFAGAAQYFIAGSWDGPSQSRKMLWSGSNYQFFVELGSLAKASFQIFKDGNPARAWYPDTDDASPHLQHQMKGPGDAFTGKRWTIGAAEDDEAKPGSRYEVRLFLNESGKPGSVDWQPVFKSAGLAEFDGRGFLAYGM